MHFKNIFFVIGTKTMPTAVNDGIVAVHGGKMRLLTPYY
jgi:hypothetical protein